MRIILSAAVDAFMQALNKAFDLSPDFIDAILIDEVRAFANKLNKIADDKEKLMHK